MPYGLNLISPPAIEPVSLDQAKSFCTVSRGFTDDDQLISGLISAAREVAETYIRRSIFNQSWLLTLDNFPLFWGRSTVKNIAESSFPYSYFFEGVTIKLPRPHCVSVSSIQYLDVNGDSQTLSSSNYVLDTNSEPARLIPAPNFYWPTATVYIPGSVQIEFVSGTWGDGVEVNTCPQNVVTAISLLAAHFYGNREGAAPIPDAFYRLLDSVRFTSFGYNNY